MSEHAAQPTQRILLPLREQDCSGDLLRLAYALLPGGGEIVLVGVVILPEESPISEGALPAQRCRQAMSDLAARFPDWTVTIRPRVCVGYEVWRELAAELVLSPVDLLLIPWDGPDGPVLGVPVDQVLSQAPCDLLLVRGMVGKCRRVLLPLRGGLHADLALRVAGALARISDGEITLLHASPPGSLVPELRGLRRRESLITRTVEAVNRPVASIIEEARGHAAIVMGAALRDPTGKQLALGSVVRQVFAQTEQTILLVRARRLGTVGLPGDLVQAAPAAPVGISAVVDRWFAGNTFNSSEFSDLEQLLRRKRAQGCTISLALPALNEAGTVGNVIATLKGALLDEVPLLDEIVLIDSNSTDDTREIAAGLGVPVYIHQHVLADEVGSFPGKGEALWKSLYVTRGDIVVWVDTDVKNIHPRFVYGLLGPLLSWESIQYVKGYYRRPIKTNGVLRAEGGGRVTELVARPLLNLFFPELSGLVQPLAGEYAGRRQALEQLPFFTGYGVETGLLIDVLEEFGLQAIAQVDLQERVHHNRPLADLSRMAFAILQVFIARLEARSKVRLLEEINRSMKMIHQAPGRFFLAVERISDVERPPMLTVPAYRRARGIV
jgi:nucleotide-binding universal stress UspA family protein